MRVARIKAFLRPILNRKGKDAFLRSLPRNATVLDVGCGNNSPFQLKLQRPDLYYIGLDVGDYNQTLAPDKYADRYLITSPEGFASEILKFSNSCDAVISSHNIEHCNQPDDVLRAMLKSLRKGGRAYLSFPCEESVSFPKRKNTLNFFTDSTHRIVPNFKKICNMSELEGLNIDFATKRNRPLALSVIGLALEPLAFLTKRNMPGGTTLALYGFESIIWASRPDDLAPKMYRMHE